MNTSGEVADLMVKESIQITEAAVKLAGLGAKNLAALLIAVLQDENKHSKGMTNLKKLLKEGKPVCIMQIKTEDLDKFNKESNNYGVLFAPVVDKTTDSPFCDIIAKQDDIPTLNYIMERMGYAAPAQEQEEQAEQPEKNAPTRAKQEEKSSKDPQRENNSDLHGNTSKKIDGQRTNTKSSVKEKIEDFKADIKEKAKPKETDKQISNTPAKSKKKKSKSKGKSK